MCKYRRKKSNKETRYKSTTLQKLHIGENLDIGCREYKFRKPKNYNKFLRRKSITFYKKTTLSNKI